MRGTAADLKSTKEICILKPTQIYLGHVNKGNCNNENIHSQSTSAVDNLIQKDRCRTSPWL